jgi:hypothetical protein
MSSKETNNKRRVIIRKPTCYGKLNCGTEKWEGCIFADNCECVRDGEKK